MKQISEEQLNELIDLLNERRILKAKHILNNLEDIKDER